MEEKVTFLTLVSMSLSHDFNAKLSRTFIIS